MADSSSGIFYFDSSFICLRSIVFVGSEIGFEGFDVFLSHFRVNSGSLEESDENCLDIWNLILRKF